MMILLLGLIFISLILNLAFYEYRVIKLPKANPKEIDLTGLREKK